MPRGGKRVGAGRPPGKPNKNTAASRAALAELASGHVKTAIETLSEIAKSGQSEAARVSASVAILDRAYGRPNLTADMEINEAPFERPREIVIRGVRPLSEDAKAEIDAERRSDGSLDFSRLSDATLHQIVGVGELIKRVS